jgi:hypothetical protein
MAANGALIPSASVPIIDKSGYIDARWWRFFRNFATNPFAVDGEGLVVATSGNTLLRQITAGSSKVSVSNGDGVAANPSIDITQSNIDHNSLLNFDTNKHIDHTTVSINPGSGLTGGGTIAANRTLSLDINSLTEDTAPDLAADFIPTYDLSATSNKKTLGINLSKCKQIKYTSTATADSTTTVIPVDNTIPQNTEGKELLTLAITPSNVNNILVIEAYIPVGTVSLAAYFTAALFQDSAADALQTTSNYNAGANQWTPCFIRHIMTAGTTSSTTFRLRYGPSTAGTAYILQTSAAGDIYSTACVATLNITEYAP